VTQKRHLLLYEMGLGKTVVTTKAMYDTNVRMILIVCPKNAIKVWENHICEWFEGLDVAAGKTSEETETTFHIWRWRKKYQNAQKRQALWRSRDPGAKVNIYIITYAAFVRDKAHFIYKYDCIVLDEAKRIRNKKSKAFEALKPLCRNSTYLWELTGTPGRTPANFWTMFHLLDHKSFSSYWQFVGAFMVIIKNGFGQMETISWKNKAQWDWWLSQKATILTKEDVGHTPTIRGKLYVDMDEDQERLYREMEADMMMLTSDGIFLASTSMEQTLRYRQLLVCPKILDPNASIGAAFADFTESLVEGEIDPHTVCFTPFTQAFDHYELYLQKHGFKHVYRLQGGLDPDEQERRIKAWRETKGIMLCSIMYAQAFSLEPAKACYFFGYEWDPEDNRQAEERLNRLTTPYQVNAYYYIYEGTYDEQQCEIVNFKQQQANRTLKRG
jgi:SNF2 family DNA or RNA helicase